MSGGKYTSESVVFEPIILPAILDTLIKCGTEAVSEAGKAVELEKLIKQEKSEYLRRMNEQITKTNDIFIPTLNILYLLLFITTYLSAGSKVVLSIIITFHLNIIS